MKSFKSQDKGALTITVSARHHDTTRTFKPQVSQVTTLRLAARAERGHPQADSDSESELEAMPAIPSTVTVTATAWSRVTSHHHESAPAPALPVTAAARRSLLGPEAGPGTGPSWPCIIGVRPLRDKLSLRLTGNLNDSETRPGAVWPAGGPRPEPQALSGRSVPMPPVSQAQPHGEA